MTRTYYIRTGRGHALARGAEYIMPIEGELMRFRVMSDPENPEEGSYLVDLAALGGNGQCDCPHFRIRLQPHIAIVAKYGHWVRCKHIRRARSYFLDEIIKELRKSEQEKRRIQ